jgi:hypothetical protein
MILSRLILPLLAGGTALAQEGPPAAPPRAEPRRAEPSSGTGFFRERRVLFWGEIPQERSPKSSPPGQAGDVESVWAEPIRTPDGRVSVYVPPKRVLEFLETPSEENARAYLAWQRERMEKIVRATEVLARLSGKEASSALPELSAMGPPAYPPANPLPKEKPASPELAMALPSPPPAAAPPSEEILYFKREGCPHCTHQDPVIQELLKERPGLKLRVLLPGAGEESWKAFDVKVVPTLVLTRADGKKVLARGFTPKETIIRALSAPQGELK